MLTEIDRSLSDTSKDTLSMRIFWSAPLWQRNFTFIITYSLRTCDWNVQSKSFKNFRIPRSTQRNALLILQSSSWNQNLNPWSHKNDSLCLLRTDSSLYVEATFQRLQSIRNSCICQPKCAPTNAFDCRLRISDCFQTPRTSYNFGFNLLLLRRLNSKIKGHDANASSEGLA